jgi:hypothetical protein
MPSWDCNGGGMSKRGRQGGQRTEIIRHENCGLSNDRLPVF